MRAGAIVGIAIVAVGLVALGAVAPGATASAKKRGREEETEVVSLELQPRKGVYVQVEIHPLLGVAEVEASMGLKGFRPRDRNGFVEYAVRIPKGPVEEKLDVRVPGVASIVGELVAASPEKSSSDPYCKGGYERSREVEFRGSFKFHGNGGYLGFQARRAKGWVQRTPSMVCESDRPESRRRDPTLWAYLHTGVGFNNSVAQVLSSQVHLPERYTTFLATHSREDPLSGFAAETAEWLPRHVAVRRYVEVAKASGQDFVAGSKEEFPESAKVRPPAPFSGLAVFARGNLRSRGRGLLVGPLYADIYGVTVRVDAREGVVYLFNLHPGF